MPRSYAIADLTLRCKQYTDMESDPSISDAEWATRISEAYGELYTIVFESGMGYYEVAANLTTTGTNTFTAPTAILSLVSLSYLVDATVGREWPLRPAMSQERVALSGLNVSAGSRATSYYQADQTVYLYPTPPSGQTYILRYVPQPAELTTASDPIDLVTPDGLLFLLWNVVVTALHKTEIDPQLAMSRLEAARDRFTESVQLRALNNPMRRISDVETEQRSSFDWDW